MRKSRVFLGMAAVSALFLAACGNSANPVRTYAMGEKVTLGHLIYTVLETQWLTQIGKPPDERIPQNRFFLVRVSVVNGGNQDLTVPNLYLEDDKGNDYQELTNGDGVPQWVGAIRSTPPAEAVSGNLVFDCPPAHYKLHVVDENNDQGAFVDIPLSFTSETPELPIPGASNKR